MVTLTLPSPMPLSLPLRLACSPFLGAFRFGSEYDTPFEYTDTYATQTGSGYRISDPFSHNSPGYDVYVRTDKDAEVYAKYGW